MVAVLTLAAGCVSGTGDTGSGDTSTTPAPSTPSSTPTSEAPDATTAGKLARLLATRDAAGFNDLVCPTTRWIPRLSTIPGTYAGTRPIGIDTVTLPTYGSDTEAVRLSVRPGAELVIMLGTGYDPGPTWCVYETEWCPVTSTGMAPFTLSRNSDAPATRELVPTVLCPT